MFVILCVCVGVGVGVWMCGCVCGWVWGFGGGSELPHTTLQGMLQAVIAVLSFKQSQSASRERDFTPDFTMSRNSVPSCMQASTDQPLERFKGVLQVGRMVGC